MYRTFKTIVAGLMGRLLTLLIPAAFLVFLLPSGAARADLEMGLDIGVGRDHEGDPLDTNDTGGDSGTGDDLHDNAGWTSGGGGRLSRLVRSTRLLIVPSYNGTTFTFRLIVLPVSIAQAEAGHAK